MSRQYTYTLLVLRSVDVDYHAVSREAVTAAMAVSLEGVQWREGAAKMVS